MFSNVPTVGKQTGVRRPGAVLPREIYLLRFRGRGGRGVCVWGGASCY